MKRSLYLLAAAAAILSLGVCTYGLPGAAAWMAYDEVRLAWLIVAGGIAGWCLQRWLAAGSQADGQRELSAWPFLAVLSMALAACAHIACAYLPNISTYPLTLGWSETSRYYYASLFFARRIYGADVPPTVLHPSRYLLQSLPFLVPGAPLWLHRAWQVFLWLFLPALCAALLARRLRLPGWTAKIGLNAAVFLLLMAGPVYYHLLPPVALVLWGFAAPPPGSPRRLWLRPLAVVVLASAWTGISRVNWYPVPAMLAAALYLMERPLVRGNALRVNWPVLAHYLAPVFGLGLLGVTSALGAQALYIVWSGNAAEQFTTSFSSDLIWRRLLPNPTYYPGILLAALLVSLPTGLVVLGRLLETCCGLPGWRRLHAWRMLGLATLLLVLFAGGLLVSVKIGGGNNLHNMDAALVMAGLLGAYFARGVAGDGLATSRDGEPGSAGRLRADAPGVPGLAATGTAQRGWLAQGGLVHLGTLLALLIPAILAVVVRGPASAPPDRQQAEAAIQTIAEAAQATARQGGEVLFISNRHLLTLGQIQGVKLVPEYERVFLMELAMAGDQEALGRFYAELKAHRFQLIVSEPLSRTQKGSEEMFGAENDVWVQRVVRYILCYYEPVKTIRPVQVQLLAPRQDPNSKCP